MSITNRIYSKLQTLNEMAEYKKDIIKRIEDKEYVLMEHLIKCLMYSDSNNLEHWKKEIYSFVNRINPLKGINKYPTYKQLKSWIINKFSDTLKQTIYAIADSINYEYHKNIEYNSAKLAQCVIAYYEWLMINLSQKGVISLQEVSKEIDALIQSYNKGGVIRI